MKIAADFHVHSRFSRATSGDLDLEHIHSAARLKGLQVVGTGDFSHPGWFAEIEAKLEPVEPGLLRLGAERDRACNCEIPASCRNPVRFVLTTEISNIYKRDGRTRKNHNLVLVPDIDTARRLNRRLEKIGNIHSDGRPILGLDARDLLEIVLEVSPDAFLVPAHIWTPWFSMLGSQSGFNSLKECFGDLGAHVFAVETGLSSDPGMNWRVSSLDGLTLVSNSDAHSPANLAREANRFDTTLDYFALKSALQTGVGFEGTLEFFPEHGKYHLDGHRDCGVRLTPGETQQKDGRCPACGKPLTIGVLSRVEALADRAIGERPPGAKDYLRLVPLVDILAEVLQAGSKTGRVGAAYRSVIEALGPELTVLTDVELGQIDRLPIPLLAEAVRRVRAGELDIRPGFDGEYGKVGIFTARERSELRGQRALFACGLPEDRTASRRPSPAVEPAPLPAPPPSSASNGPLPQGGPNADQERALTDGAERLLIVAGPGTGKTHTLTRRIGRLIGCEGVPAERILALTFTNRAAEEMRARVAKLLGGGRPLPLVCTIHGFCLMLLGEDPAFDSRIVDDEEQQDLLAEAASMAASGDASAPNGREAALRGWVMRAKQNLLAPDAIASRDGPRGYAAVYLAYQQLLQSRRLMDFEDLIGRVVARMEADPDYALACRGRFAHVMVDEYQDLNCGQHRLIRNLAPTGCSGTRLCVIGDPDQSIYGFRGSDRRFFDRFTTDYPDAHLLRLTRNYRSTDAILTAAFQVICRDGSPRARTISGIDGVQTVGVLDLPDEHAEAEAIARRIEFLIGGTGYHSIDTGRAQRPDSGPALGYADFAVLTRTNEQVRLLAERFREIGVPCQAVSRRRVFQEDGIRELLSFLKAISGRGTHADLERIFRVLDPGLGKKVAVSFKAWCIAGRMSPEEGLAGAVRFPIPGLGRERQLRLLGLVRRLNDLRTEAASLPTPEALARIAGEPKLASLLCGEVQQEALGRLAALADADDHGRDLGRFLDRAALQSDTDCYYPHAERVALISMHAAKGLEFPVVFVAGCEDGFIPLRTADDPEEERRLFYVAMTRARQRLYLTRARRRRVFGKVEERARSPLLLDIEPRWLEDESPAAGAAKRAHDQLRLF
jgi:uncharacterized protein (TIGR00375 family)